LLHIKTSVVIHVGHGIHIHIHVALHHIHIHVVCIKVVHVVVQVEFVFDACSEVEFKVHRTGGTHFDIALHGHHVGLHGAPAQLPVVAVANAGVHVVADHAHVHVGVHVDVGVVHKAAILHLVLAHVVAVVPSDLHVVATRTQQLHCYQQHQPRHVELPTGVVVGGPAGEDVVRGVHALLALHAELVTAFGDTVPLGLRVLTES